MVKKQANEFESAADLLQAHAAIVYGDDSIALTHFKSLARKMFAELPKSRQAELLQEVQFIAAEYKRDADRLLGENRTFSYVQR